MSCKDEAEIVLTFKKDFVHMCSVIQFVETLRIICKGNICVWKINHKIYYNFENLVQLSSPE